MKKILVITYAFPPLKVPVMPCVAKVVVGLNKIGYTVDVVCADAHTSIFLEDKSLLPFVKNGCENIMRLQPNSLVSKTYRKVDLSFFDITIEKIISIPLMKRIARFFLKFKNPDLMSILNDTMFNTLVEMNLCQYKAVISFSPFYSVNLMMVRLKKKFPQLRWIAQFSDPWAQNPLERSKSVRFWANWHELNTVYRADYIVHNSIASHDSMMKKYALFFRRRSMTIPHPFDKALYPVRLKRKNEKIVLRYVGTVFGCRSPETFFMALNLLLQRRKDLTSLLSIEFLGNRESDVLPTPAEKALPPEMLRWRSSVSYIDSLEEMYDADILILLEAAVKKNLFVPSKLSDYIGANTPILGIVPSGPVHDIIVKLGGWHAHPSDIEEIATALESIITFSQMRLPDTKWYNENISKSFEATDVANQYAQLIEEREVLL